MHTYFDWEDDYLFRRLADLLWPDDYRTATNRVKGMQAARRAMQERYEGFYAHRRLAESRRHILALADDVKSRLG